MSTHYLQKFDSTAALVAKSADRSKAAGVGVVSNEPYINQSGTAKKITHAGDNPVIGAASGYKIARGEVALDGSNPTTVATGLTTIVAAVACLKGSSAPGDNTSVLTVDFTGSDGNLDIYGWKNTGGTDPTLVASTGTESVEWIAIGT